MRLYQTLLLMRLESLLQLLILRMLDHGFKTGIALVLGRKQVAELPGIKGAKIVVVVRCDETHKVITLSQ